MSPAILVNNPEEGGSMQINWVDIIIVVFIVMAFIQGKKKGFNAEWITVIITGAAWLVALHFYQPVGEFINTRFLFALATANDIAFGLLAGIVLLLGLFAGKMVIKVIKLNFSASIEKYGGLIAGGIKGIIVAAIVIVFLALMPADFVQREVYTNSFLGNYLVALSPKVHQWLWPGIQGRNSRFSTLEFWAQLPQRPKKEIL